MESLLINVAVFGTIYGATFWLAKWRGAGSPRFWAAGVTIAAAIAAQFMFNA